MPACLMKQRHAMWRSVEVFIYTLCTPNIPCSYTCPRFLLSTMHACMRQGRGALAKALRMRNKGWSAPRRLQQGALLSRYLHLGPSACSLAHMSPAHRALSAGRDSRMTYCSTGSPWVSMKHEGCCLRAASIDKVCVPLCSGVMMCITLLASGFIIGACPPSITTALAA